MRQQDSKKAYEKPKNRQKKFFSGLFRCLDTFYQEFPLRCNTFLMLTKNTMILVKLKRGVQKKKESRAFIQNITNKGRVLQ